MKRMMLFTMTLLIGLTLLAPTNSLAKEIVNKSKSADTNQITKKDVELMWEKANLGIKLVNQFWQAKFAQNGFYYRQPQVKYYTSPVNTSCGKLTMDNAFYCSKDHTIYFDALFFTRLMKGVGSQFGTDGDMAIIFVLAHEWGHAVQSVRNMSTNITTLNETTADCMSGAFTLYADQQGLLEKGDIEEAALTISLLGDDGPWGQTHGDSEERLMMFRRGIKKGLVGCGGFNY